LDHIREKTQHPPLCAGITKRNCSNFNNLGCSAAVLPLVKHFAHFLWDMRKGNCGFFLFFLYVFFEVTKLTITFQIIYKNIFGVYISNGKLKIIPTM